MTEITQADRDAAKHFWQKSFEDEKYTLPQAFARHRMEERAAIVAWLRDKRPIFKPVADAIEAGGHLK